MKTTIKWILVTISLGLFLSCKKENEGIQNEISNNQKTEITEKVKDWVDSVVNSSNGTNLFLDSVLHTLDIRKIKTFKVNNNFFAYAPIKYNFNECNLIFQIDEKLKIQYSIISEIKNDQGSSHDSNLIESVYKNAKTNFNGSIAVYSTSNRFLGEKGFQNGEYKYFKKTEYQAPTNSNIKTNSTTATDIKRNDCFALYLVTYWSNGTVDRQLIGISCTNSGGDRCEQTGSISQSGELIFRQNCSSSNVGGGGGESYDIINYVVYSGPKPINNILDYIKCFTKNGSNFKITIFVDQPTSGTSLLVSKSGGVGHVFVGFSQTLPNGAEVTRNIGFYPQGNANPFSPSSPGQLNNDENHAWDIGVEVSISGDNFMKALNYMTGSQATTYNLNSNNCTSIVLGSIHAGNVDIFSQKGYLNILGVEFHGYNPGNLGQDLRNLYPTPEWKLILPPSDSNSSSSHPNKGSCN